MAYNSNVAWWCDTCGRIEQPADEKHCHQCGDKLIRCSRYEWFLFDQLDHLLGLSGRDYDIIQQYPILDHRGFVWRFDIYVWVKGNSFYGGYHELIEVNGTSHSTQGGVVRDSNKHWEVFSNLRLHKKGWDYRVVTNDECACRIVHQTAKKIVVELIQRSDTWS